MGIPSYLRLLESGELQQRADQLDRLLRGCTICPWQCGVDRASNRTGACVSGYLPIASSWAPHFGEEPAISGTVLPRGQAKGAGNVFLGNCNLRCVYCQNWQISQQLQHTRLGDEMSCDQLAEILLDLQQRGCHNIGFVSPTHFAPQIVRSVLLGAHKGLRLPLVYNTNSYDSVEVLRLLDGIFDIYLPDLKYSDDDMARTYSKAANYVRHARTAIMEMYRQVGHELVLDERGLLQRGLIIRLLILPNDLAGIRESLQWIRDSLSPRVTISVMSQYYPSNKVTEEHFPLLSRKIRPREYEKVLEWLDEFGFEHGWIQPLEAEAPSYYQPDFRNRQMPFQEAVDFDSAVH
jgi:putative pyruvate formate lyase activating enzyme